jgi:uncharacterized protein YjiS (DUF1127 family)
MATIDGTEGAAGRPWSALRTIATVLRDGARRQAVRVSAAATAWWRAYCDRHRRRRAIAELQAFSDRELNDIGVRRSEIYWVVHHGPEVARPPAKSLPTARPRPHACKPGKETTPFAA